MALQKDYTEKGFTSSYWMIGSFAANKENNDTNVTLRLYKDNDTRNGDIKAYTKSIDVRVHEYLTDPADIYAAIKDANTPLDTQDENGDAVKFFADAQDV